MYEIIDTIGEPNILFAVFDFILMIIMMIMFITAYAKDDELLDHYGMVPVYSILIYCVTFIYLIVFFIFLCNKKSERLNVLLNLINRDFFAFLGFFML